MRRWQIPRPLRLFAPAKVNLSLEVLKRREDGYHDVVTVMETISLFDVIDIHPSSDRRVVSNAEIDSEDDLVSGAIDALESTANREICLNVTVKKQIPIAAGLGGGSSDAGIVITALGTLLGLSPRICHRIGASLGSDVPFFLEGGVARATGTGTDLEVLPTGKRRWYVISVPRLDIPQKTATLYGSLRSSDFGDDTRGAEIAGKLRRNEPVDPADVANTFQRPLLQHEAFRNAVDVHRQAGSTNPIASGAGPAVFTLCSSYSEAKRFATQVRPSLLETWITTSVSPGLNQERIREVSDS
jgi:4-diphosphocytidyl-2-C-methyl-D-erythritol kinase